MDRNNGSIKMKKIKTYKLFLESNLADEKVGKEFWFEYQW